MGSSGGLNRRQVSVAGRSLTSWRPSWAWAGRVLRSFVTSVLALTVVLWLLPGTQVTDGTWSVVSLAVVVLVAGALLRPFLITLTVLTGPFGLLFAGLVAQGLVLGLALAAVPTIEPFSPADVLVASWAVTIVTALINWLFDSSTEEAFLGQVMGRTMRTARRHPVAGPGLLVVQLDGVSEPLLRQAMTSGAMPNVAAWLRSGGHRLRGWHTGLPATTPAGQAVLLHGDATSVPGFRWYDKELRRVLVCSNPGDVAEVEAGLSDGRGLLADGGVSVSNLFSGDAPTRALTMSDARLPSSQQGAASFMNSRNGFGRSVLLFLGEILLEWHQGRRQRLRNVIPRVPRRGSFVFLRGLTTVVLRDLNVSIVADQMARGARAIYVDFVDYDEVAHHAGPSRPESMHTLEGLDRILGFFAQIADEAGRDYEIAVLSDHGQAQGSTFLQLAGQTLGELVTGLAGSPARVHRDEAAAEPWAAANMLRAGAPASGRLIGRAARSVARGGSGQLPDGSHDDPGASDDTGGADGVGDQLRVISSGSLAHIYLCDEPGQITRERIDERHPALVPGLAAHAHIGVVLSRQYDGVLRADGADGWREVTADGATGGSGEDPLAVYGISAAADLTALAAKAHAGDLILLGAFDRQLGEVAAFEELVGSHGGLGGWQTRAFLAHPVSWQVSSGALDGLAVHRTMVDRLEHLGLRNTVVEAHPVPTEVGR